MASKAATTAAGGVMGIATKQCIQSTGIWERIRRTLSLDPNRSNGVPLNPYFRNPPPGALDPLGYDDPVTLPAGDVADNAYWKRDARRNYPRVSVVGQAQAAALLTVGSKAEAKVELIGDRGAKALVAAGEARLADVVGGEGTKDAVLGEGGLPPLPSGACLGKQGWEVRSYEMLERGEQAYPEKYPCRTFK